MSQYSRINVQNLYNNINITLDKLKAFINLPVSINTKSNNTIPIKLMSDSLKRIYNDTSLNGSIKTLIDKLSKLELAVANINKLQDMEQQLEKLKLAKYSPNGSVNTDVVNQIVSIEHQLYHLETNINNSLNHIE